MILHAHFSPHFILGKLQSLHTFECGSCQIVELPYGAGSVSMFIVLPGQPGRRAFDETEAALQGINFVAFLNQVAPTSVNVLLPRFEFSQSLDLVQSLQFLGVTSLFDFSADLSGISNTPLYVSSATHKAKIKVDEEGTTAAAATIIQAAFKSAGPILPSFVADRPFIFFIVDNISGVILFMGNVQQFPPLL